VGTRSSGGAGVSGGSGAGRFGSEGPIAVDWPSGGPILSSRCDLDDVEHATPNALAMMSEPAIALMEVRRFMMSTDGAKRVPST
jgi:hypothetical protein